MSKIPYGTKMVICKGRLKGEVVKVIGESNLNMEHVIIFNRSKGRKRQMAFDASWLQKVEG